MKNLKSKNWFFSTHLRQICSKKWSTHAIALTFLQNITKRNKMKAQKFQNYRLTSFREIWKTLIFLRPIHAVGIGLKKLLWYRCFPLATLFFTEHFQAPAPRKSFSQAKPFQWIVFLKLFSFFLFNKPLLKVFRPMNKCQTGCDFCYVHFKKRIIFL